MRIGLFMLTLISSLACRPSESSEIESVMPHKEKPLSSHEELIANLHSLLDSKSFLFGQQRATLTGVGREGDSPWSDWAYGTPADTATTVGQTPAVLGIDVWDYAMKNPTWNQASYAKAIRDFYAEGQGGLITFEWHMRACDIKDQIEPDGSRGVPGEGFQIKDWEKDSNRSCLCRIVNEERWVSGKTWKDWLLTQKLDRFATKLQAEGLDQLPLLFRPFHEMNGSWFWWGQKSWDCQKHLGHKARYTGVEAYKQLFKITVDHLRKKRGLKNLLFTFSPDKLCTHEGHACDQERVKRGTLRDSDYYTDLLNLYPGSAYVDILGLDLYFPEMGSDLSTHPQVQATRFIPQLRTLSQMAKDFGKLAALTETGSYNLHNEREESLNWFSQYLLPLMTANPDIQLIYALVWENRNLKPKEYYIPPFGHAAFRDFGRFIGNKQTYMYEEVKGIYSSSFDKRSTP